MVIRHQRKVALGPGSSALEGSIFWKVLYKEFLFKMVETKFLALKKLRL